jgi:lipopolysaccharide biosynthesis glycosyltransferase
MDDKQMIGMVEEAPHSYFYKAYKNFQPLIGKYGAMSGTLIMNLTRMREFEWVSKLKKISENYANENKKYYFDQGLINILLSSHPGGRIIHSK